MSCIISGIRISRPMLQERPGMSGLTPEIQHGRRGLCVDSRESILPPDISFFLSNSLAVSASAPHVSSARPEGDTFKGHLDSESAARPALLSRSVLGHWGHLLLHCLSLSIFLFHLSPGPSASPSPSRTQRSRRRIALEVPRPLLALGDQRRAGHGWPARRCRI